MVQSGWDEEKILEWEFEYARSTAEQAQDDRTAMVNLYLILVGGVGSIVLALPQVNTNSALQLSQVQAVLFGLLGITGFFILMTLIRLRQAWQDSALAMNHIKDQYVKRFPQLGKSFLWRTTTLPEPGKLWTITFNLAFLVMILDSMALGLACHFIEPREWLNDFWFEGIVGVIFFIGQMWFYFHQLPRKKK